MRHKQKDFSLPGGYRKIIEKPKKLEWYLFILIKILIFFFFKGSFKL